MEKKENQRELRQFLENINLPSYLINFVKNGFDDLNMLIEHMKESTSTLTDDHLKDIGIALPGDRAKILIKLEDAAGNFSYEIPVAVFYKINTKKVNYDNLQQDDLNIKLIYNWLLSLKLDKYLPNFVGNGYHSLELILIQMASRYNT